MAKKNQKPTVEAPAAEASEADDDSKAELFAIRSMPKTGAQADKAVRSNKRASRILEQHIREGGDASGASLSTRLEIDRVMRQMDADERKSQDAAVSKFMRESGSAEAVRKRRQRTRARFVGVGPDDPEAGTPVDNAALGGAIPEPPLKNRVRAERSNSPRAQQTRILSEGTADEYWKHVEKHSAFTGLGATRGGKPVSGFCTNCDNPIMRSDVEPLIEHKETGRPINTRAEGGMTHPIDDSLCDTCQPHAGTITPAGQAALQDKFNVARGERG